MLDARRPSECRKWRSSPQPRSSNCRPWPRASTSCSTSDSLTKALSSRSGKMTFDELDDKMRVFETAADYCVLPEIFMVARLDGRSFTRLTKEVCKFEAPFDERFRDMMVTTTESVMNCGFQIVYAYTESDEISLLF